MREKKSALAMVKLEKREFLHFIIPKPSVKEYSVNIEVVDTKKHQVLYTVRTAKYDIPQITEAGTLLPCNWQPIGSDKVEAKED